MKSLIILAIFSILTGILTSCSNHTFDDKESLMTYLQDEENGYLSHKTVNGIDFRLLFRPTDLLVEQELGEHFTKEDVDSLREKYNKYLYFNLSISKNNQEILSALAGNRSRFSAMVNTLSFGMKNKLNLITEARDTIPLADYIYPRMYGMTGATTIMLVYPTADVLSGGDSFRIVVKDLNFGTGEVGFRFKTDEAEKQPQFNFR